jgi:hypothetical protein
MKIMSIGVPICDPRCDVTDDLSSFWAYYLLLAVLHLRHVKACLLAIGSNWKEVA